MDFIPSPYWSDRGGRKIDVVVIHTMDGYYGSTIKYFQSNAARVSSQYLVSLTGDMVQMVQDKYAAHHAGKIVNPSASIVKQRLSVSPNLYSIGIENEDGKNPGGADRTRQYASLIMLVADVCKRHGIPVDRDHIIGHREIRNDKSCPGNLDVDYIVREVKKLEGGTMPDYYVAPSGAQYDLSNRASNEATAKMHDEVMNLKLWTKLSNDNQYKVVFNGQQLGSYTTNPAKKAEELERQLSDVINKIAHKFGLSPDNKNLDQILAEVQGLIDAANNGGGNNGTNPGELPTSYNNKEVLGVIIKP